MKSFFRLCAPLALSASFLSLATAQSKWLPYGPYGGDARAFAQDPHDHNHIYLGTVSGTVYDTHDGGNTWKFLADVGKRDDLVFDNLIVDPANPNRVLAAGWVLSSADGGLYISNDAGKTWTENADMKGKSIRSMTVAPSNPKLMLIGTVQEGVYRSEDGGDHWKLISPPGSREIHEVESVAFDPKDPNRMYAGTWHLPWRTTDGGATWQNMKEGIIDDSDVFSIIVDPTNPSNVYLSACSGIYRSNDQGMKYTKVQGIPSTARRTRVLMEDAKTPNTVFAGTTEGLWRTTDAGHTFARYGDPSWIINDVNIDPQNSNRVLLATDRTGVLISNDGGQTFAPANTGFTQRQITAVAQDRKNPAHVYVGVINDKMAGGVFESQDGGLSWVQKSAGLNGSDVFSLVQAPDGTMLAGTRHGIMRWDGNLWKNSGLTLALPPLPDPDAAKKAAAATPKTRTGKAAAAAAAARARSKPPRIAPPHNTPPQEANSGVFAFAVNGNTVFAATEEGLLNSTDNGLTWNHVRSATGEPWRIVKSEGARVVVADLHKIAISTDSGANFHVIQAPTELTYLTSVAVDDGGRVWVGGREGVWLSENDGSSWHTQQGLYVPNVSGIHYDSEGKRVLVTANRPSTLVFAVNTKNMKVTYQDAGWPLRTTRAVGDHLIGITPFDGIVLAPRMVDSPEKPLEAQRR
ncbi:WD40/YVTN/BNR-like repeat-containing protein [Terriglobus sp. ADX1]|uniref:WD40/YVTN/BNR-like repeat-containing protein n=1 Tax=Terriglobus sp. ADX1 TaxID=2794063 RepID=UPI002FE5CDEA